MAIVSSSRNAPAVLEAAGVTHFFTVSCTAGWLPRRACRASPRRTRSGRPPTSSGWPATRRWSRGRDQRGGGRRGRQVRARDRGRPRRRGRRATEAGADVVVRDLAELPVNPHGAGPVPQGRRRSATPSTAPGSRSTSGGWWRPASTTPTSAPPSRCSASATATSACAATTRRAATSTPTAPSSTASTRPGRSCTPRRRSGSPRSARPSSTHPTPRSSGSTSTTSRWSCRPPTCSSTSACSTSAPACSPATSCGVRPSGKRVRVESTRMVSFTQRHLAMMTFEVTLLDAGAPVSISSQLLNRADGENEHQVLLTLKDQGMDPRKAERFSHRVLVPETHQVDHSDGRLSLGYHCAQSGMTIAVAADHQLETTNAFTSTRSRATRTSRRRSTASRPSPGARSGSPRRSATTPAGWCPPHELLDRCERTLDRVREEGVQKHFVRPGGLPRRLLGALRRRGARAAGHPAGGAVEPLLGDPGRRPRRRLGHPGEGRDRLRLRRPLLLGHRDLRDAVPHLHDARGRPATRCGSATRCSTRRAPGPASSPRRARSSRGARSTARRPRPTTPPAPRSTTSTPTSPTR